MKTIEFVYQEGEPLRLDKVLTLEISRYPEFEGVTRTVLQRWIVEGQVLVDAVQASRSNQLIAPGARIAITIPEVVAKPIESSGRPLEILFQDEELLVINKPAGLSMHPGAGRAEDTLVHAVVGYLSQEERERGIRPGLVHRLDMDTTGVVVVAKTPRAHLALSRQFASRTTDREYLSLVFSTPRGKRQIDRAEEGTVDTQIGRHPKRRQQFAVIAEGGRHAITHWRVIEPLGYGKLLALKLGTGRTHQIRVHLAHLGSPVIGDKVYGDFSGLPDSLKKAAERFGRQALHARTLGFIHPKTEAAMSFTAEPPADFSALVECFRNAS